MPRRLVIAGGTGRIGQKLAANTALREAFDVRVLGTSASVPAAVADGMNWPCDLTSVSDAAVACAGAKVIVFLARVTRPARLVQGELSDFDLLMADSVARAAQRVQAERIVFFACGSNDRREAILRSSQVPLAVLRGGGSDPSSLLLELINASEAKELVTPEGDVAQARPERPLKVSRLWSVQTLNPGKHGSGEALARAYFEFLPSASPMTRVEEVDGTFRLISFGKPLLVLRHNPGRSEADCYVLDVVDGALVAKSVAAPGGTVKRTHGRLEFRVLRDGSAKAAVVDFESSLPWPLYRVSQALAHARTMRLFGASLEQ